MQKYDTLIKCNQAYVVAKDILFYLNTKNFLHSERTKMEADKECKPGEGRQ